MSTQLWERKAQVSVDRQGRRVLGGQQVYSSKVWHNKPYKLPYLA